MGTINHPAMKDKDLSVSVLLTPEEAAAGSYVNVVTPLDGEIPVKIPEGIQAGTMLRLRGLGSRQGNSDERGDLYIKIMIMMANERLREQSLSGEGLGFRIVGGCIVALGVILILGNITGMMPTFPFAGFLVTVVGGIVSSLGKTLGT
jgi:hypothetical protein